MHPHGNIRIAFTKRFVHILSSSIFFIFKIFYPKIDTKTNGIIISRATFKPWTQIFPAKSTLIQAPGS